MRGRAAVLPERGPDQGENDDGFYDGQGDLSIACVFDAFGHHGGDDG